MQIRHGRSEKDKKRVSVPGISLRLIEFAFAPPKILTHSTLMGRDSFRRVVLQKNYVSS